MVAELATVGSFVRQSPTPLPWPSRVRISLPRCDLHGEERWLISEWREALNPFLNGL